MLTFIAIAVRCIKSAPDDFLLGSAAMATQTMLKFVTVAQGNAGEA